MRKHLANTNVKMNQRQRDSIIVREFIDWVYRGIKDKSLPINTNTACIHTTMDGIFLIVPIVFDRYGELMGFEVDQVKDVKRALMKQQVHRVHKDGHNIWTYLANGRYRLQGIVFPYQVFFPEIPSINVSLTQLAIEEMNDSYQF